MEGLSSPLPEGGVSVGVSSGDSSPAGLSAGGSEVSSPAGSAGISGVSSAEGSFSVSSGFMPSGFSGKSGPPEESPGSGSAGDSGGVSGSVIVSPEGLGTLSPSVAYAGKPMLIIIAKDNIKDNGFLNLCFISAAPFI